MDAPVQPNGQQTMLIDQLRDIRLPEPASWWPPAPGWWVVAALFLLVLLLVARFFQKRWLEKQYRREAQQLLADLHANWQNDKDARAFASGAHQLLRRIVIHHVGRDGVARLTGRAFIDRANTLSSSTLSASTGSLLTSLGYRPSLGIETELDVEEVRRELEAWLLRLERPRRA